MDVTAACLSIEGVLLLEALRALTMVDTARLPQASLRQGPESLT